jgi:hypothetical protein
MSEKLDKKATAKLGVSVRLVGKSDTTALIEWLDSGGLKRAYLPLADIDGAAAIGDSVTVADPSLGIPYGVDWAQIPVSITSQKLADTLRQYGIWTEADALANPMAVQGAILSIVGLDLSTVLNFAHQAEHKAKE